MEDKLKEQFDKVDKLKENILNPDLTPEQKLEMIEDYEKETLGYIPNIVNIIDNMKKGPSFISKKTNG